MSGLQLRSGGQEWKGAGQVDQHQSANFGGLGLVGNVAEYPRQQFSLSGSYWSYCQMIFSKRLESSLIVFSSRTCLLVSVALGLWDSLHSRN